MKIAKRLESLSFIERYSIWKWYFVADFQSYLHWSWSHNGPVYPSSQKHVPGIFAEFGSSGSARAQDPWAQPPAAIHLLHCWASSDSSCIKPIGHLQKMTIFMIYEITIIWNIIIWVLIILDVIKSTYVHFPWSSNVALLRVSPAMTQEPPLAHAGLHTALNKTQ